MLGVRKSVGAVFLALAACAVAGEGAAGVLGPSEQNRLRSVIERRPMVFFVAKGPADSCGKGCSEWIAAVGEIDRGAAERLLELTGRLDGRKLPVFFHSPGGISGAGMKIGDELRERRMAVGIGRTEAKCRVFDKKDKGCQDKIKAGEAIPAKLVTDDAACMSSCVYAFAGASSRQVAPQAVLGVHSPKFNDFTKPLPTIPRNASREKLTKILAEIANPKPTSEQVANYKKVERRYYLKMGINPDLTEFANKIPHQKMYLLDRNEIARFGLVSRNDGYELPWTSFEDANGKFWGVKSIARRTAEENLVIQIYLACSQTGKPLISYRRELPNDPDQAKAFVGVSFDDLFLEFRSSSMKSGVETGGFAVRALYDDMVAKFATAKTLTIWEQGTGENKEIAKTNFSNAGLPTTLNEFRKHCKAESVQNPLPGFGSISLPPTVKILPVKPAGMPVTSEKAKQAEPVLAPETMAPDSKKLSEPPASAGE